MTTIRAGAEDYLAIRRSLGFKLGTQGRVLMDFVACLERAGMDTVTTEAAVEWATTPCGASALWHAMRLGVARRFAAHLQLLDPGCEVPPPDLLPERHRRLPPHLFSAEDIAALMTEARLLHPSFRAATAETVIGLLAVTGLRAGELVRLNRDDVDFTAGALAVRATKFNKSRVLALHDTTVQALRAYAIVRDQRWPHACSPAFFMSVKGSRLSQSALNVTFTALARAAGLEPAPSERGRRPTPHGLRHSFAVTTLIDWYRAGDDVQARLPALSAFMGHAQPKDTYWYVSAVPELLALASDRARRHSEARS
jgi:integrase/recombinase XerD